MDYSSSIIPPLFSFKYDVFLSFRGEDTRYSFTSHLYEALRYKQIEVYVDELQLQRGEEISPAHLKAIIESKISVIIFSKNYATSRWCLDELVHIFQSKYNHNRIVIPVYYDIEPADVRRQTKTFADAFEKHKLEDYVKIWRWRAALTEAVSLSGYDLQDFESESELKQAIVKEILNKLNTHTMDIRGEDSGHEDKEGQEVPKITVERMFVASNLILEVPSAVFDQLSSVHKPQYVLASMLMSLTTMLICIIELVYKGGEAGVGWRWGKKRIPWFYYPPPSYDKPFGTVTEFIGLLCSFFQCICSVSDYVFYLRNINYPVKISIWPLVFAFCLLCSTFSKKSPKLCSTDDLTNKRVFTCKTCNKEFPSFQVLGGHRASHKKPKFNDRGVAGGEVFEAPPESPKKPKTHECSIGGVKFAIGQALGGHMRRHRTN